MVTKFELRKNAKEIRNSLDIKGISKSIVKNIQDSDAYKNAQNIMIFYPLEHEVDLRALLGDNKQFYLPKVQGENLLVCPFKEGDELFVSDFKTKEPQSKPVDASVLDIIFVPALMVDKNFNRLGYGGGFYDKFLAKYSKNVKKVVAIPKALIIDSLPFEPFDVKTDVIICEDFVIY